MKVQFKHVKTPVPPLKEVTVTFTRTEWSDLLVIAHIPKLNELLLESTRSDTSDSGCQTNDIYGLMTAIRDAERDRLEGKM